MALGDITHASIDGSALTASLVTKYTVPASRVLLLLEIVLCNTDTVPRTVQIQFIESGGSAAIAKRVVDQQAGTALAPGESRSYSFNPMLEASDFIQAMASVTSVVAFRGSVTLKEV